MQGNQDKELYMYLKTVFKSNLLRTVLKNFHRFINIYCSDFLQYQYIYNKRIYC